MENKLSSNAKVTTRIILEYLEKFPNSPSKTLARKIYSDNEGYFDKFENVYSKVRYYRGQMGKFHRKYLANKEFQKELKVNIMQNFVSLPSSLSQKRGTFTFPTGCRKLGVIGDLHIPYHDEDAIETACDKMEAEGVDSILINGDLLDFYQLSFHEKDRSPKSGITGGRRG